jgi:hypothetical protein
MGQGRFINQKLGKRMSRRLALAKAQLPGQKSSTNKLGPTTKRSKIPGSLEKKIEGLFDHAP